MKPRSLVILLLLTLLAAGCGGKDKVKNETEAQPGRDKELYETAMKKLRKGRYDESRLLFNVVITTYPDSEYLPLAKLAIADSFYREGGSSQLEQAIGGYKDFTQYFPTHPLSCHVRLKIAEAYMRQINAYNRDWTKARQAEHQLLDCQARCQNSELKPQIEGRLAQVQQVLGLHELDIARFYFKHRQAYTASASRLRDVVEKYPHFTYRDEALFLLGQSLIEQEQPEEAAQYFTELARQIPNSEYAPKAKEYLEKLGKPVPEPANDDPAPPRPGMMKRFGLLIGQNDLTISKSGVLITEKGEADQEAAQKLQNPVEATGGTGPVKASSTLARPVNSSSEPAPANSKAAQPNGNGNGQTAAPGAKDAKKADDAKKEEKKKDPKKGEKKGFLGRIFR